MIKFIILTVLLLATLSSADDLDKRSKRQAKFLFYDEAGRLVNIYSNPYLQNFFLNAGNLPLFWNFLNPFFNYLRPISVSGTSACFLIPVSDQVIQNLFNNPMNQNQLTIQKKEPVIQPNAFCAGKRGSFSSSKSCGSFLNCWDGWAFEQECPAGLMFSNAGYCDYADNVNCNNRLRPQDISLCSQDFQTFRNKANCNEFFVCVGRQPVKFKCPADLAYNERLGVCDYQNRVECSGVLADSPELPVQPTKPSLPVDIPTNPPSGVPTELPIGVPTGLPIAVPTEAPNVPSEIPGNIATSVPSLPALPKKPFDKGFMVSNTIFKKENWAAAHEASSRQEAIYQLMSTRNNQY